MNVKYRPYLLITLLGLLLYSWSAFFDYSFLDDHVLILENYSIIHNLSNLGNIFTNDVFFATGKFYYRPLLNVSLMFDSFISGNLPWFFHLVNVLLHISATCLVFVLLNKLKSPRTLSFLLSLLFLFHPALVQAVAWIPGRNDSLLAIFVIGAFLYFLKFLEAQKPINFIFYIIFFLLALFTKETAVFLPILLGFYYLFLHNDKLALSDKLIFSFGTLAAVFLWFIFRSLAIPNSNLYLSTILQSIFDNSSAFIIGLGKFFFPLDLSVMSAMKDIYPIYGIVAVLILVLIGVSKWGAKKEYFIFGLLWYLLFFIPSLINPNSANIYYFLEHRLYLPFIGLLIIFSQIKFLQNINYKKVISYLPFIIILVFGVFLSANHLPNFRNRLSFWQSAVASSPSAPMAHRNLGAMLYFDGRTDEAIIQYKLALDDNTYEPMAHNNIGLIYMERGNLEEAEFEFKKELEINPGYDKALANLEGLLILKNRLR